MFVHFFPLLAILLSAVAWFLPAPFVACKEAIVPLLGVVMFGMGMTLSPRDFDGIVKRPSVIAIGLCLQFGVMPLAAWAVGNALQLSQQYLIGMILVGACSGGTASNVICYLAKGDVALSITLTALSTLLAIFATPALTWLYAGHIVEVAALSMLLTILNVILLPVGCGMVINYFAGVYLRRLQHLFPVLSITSIVLIIAIIVALNRDAVAQLSALLMIAVILHNLSGLATGYAISRLCGHSHKIAKTLSIEVGMQNSGLAVVLATKYFSAAAALPGALFSIWHNLSGSALAAWWNRRETQSAASST